MDQTVTLQLPAETLQRYRRDAAAARKVLEEFLADRLAEIAPPSVDDLPSPLREELRAMEQMSDPALLELAQSHLPATHQRRYNHLLRKNSEETLSPRERATLRTLGDQARLLTLKKAHAYMLLKWRGHPISSPAQQW